MGKKSKSKICSTCGGKRGVCICANRQAAYPQGIPSGACVGCVNNAGQAMVQQMAMGYGR